MSRLPKKGYTYSEQLLLEAVRSTYGIPTVGLLAAGFGLGFKFIVPKLEWALKETTEVVEEITNTAGDLYADAIFRAKATRDGIVVPVTTFTSDAKACYESSKINIPFVGRAWVPPLSSNYFAACMAQKGYLGDTIQEFLSR